MHHVFISYSRADAAWVESVVGALDERDVDVWIDREDIPVSIEWLAAVHDAIEESALFLVCDSATWRSSESCQLEVDYATKFAKRSCQVAVGSDPHQAAYKAAAALQAVPRSERSLTELVVRARDWDRNGRPRSALVGLAASWTFSQHFRDGRTSDVTRAFVAASRRRGIRRRTTAITGALLIVLALLYGALSPFAWYWSAKTDAQQTESLFRSDLARSIMDVDPYEGLRFAAELSASNTASDADVLTRALATPVPDDAFSLPTRAVRFATSPVADVVEVIDEAGATWSRDADAHDSRHATPQPEGTASTAPENRWDERFDRRSGIVHIDRDGRLHRTIVVPAPPQSVAVSPDGREAAAAAGADVHVVDLETGDRRVTLRGAPATITDVVWSTDSGRIWAIAGKVVVSWQRREGQVVLDEPAHSFQALIPAAEPGFAWLASRDGVLRRIELETGRIVDSRTVDDELLYAAGNPTGDTAIVVATKSNRLVRLDSADEPIAFDVHDCSPGRPAWSLDSGSFYVPCTAGPVVEIAATGEEIRRIDIPEYGARSVTVFPQSGRVLVGGLNGLISVVTDEGTAEPIHRIGCGAPLLAMEVAPQESAIVPVGEGSGLFACATIGYGEGDGWDWHHYVAEAHSARRAVFTASGTAFAVGYTDGSIIVRPTEDLLPAITLTSVHGAVRDMLMAPEGELYVATQTGVLEELTICDCLTIAGLAQVARQRLDRAVELGLA